MDDPIDSAFQSRRFAHGKSKAKSGRGRGGGVSKPFNPSAAFGQYEVSLGGGGGTSKAFSRQHILEIQEFTKCETGLLGTFDFGSHLKGMFVLAGSRKGLAEIVTRLEGKEEADDYGDDDANGKNNDNADTDGEGSHGSDQEGPEDVELSAIEQQDEKMNRRARAFEKNSFRNPKFWINWKGTHAVATTAAAAGAETTSPESSDRHVESNMGYLVFSNNACEKFEGTFTCPSLDWENLKLKGRKVRSKASSCLIEWNGIH